MMILNNSNGQQSKFITELSKNLYRIQTPLKGNSLRSINSYLIKGSDRNLLIDTGYRMDLCMNSIKNGLKKLDAELRDTDILLTHFHNDHSGASTQLIHPTRTIYVPEQEYPFFGIGINPEFYTVSRKPQYTKEGLTEEEFGKFMYFGTPNIRAPDFFSKQFTPIKESQVISAGEYELTAIHTPGHTPGHMCYWDEQHGIIFTGDHILFDISSNIIPWPGIPNILGLYLYSLKKLQPYSAAAALPGHREPGELSVRIEQLLQHHQQRLNECESLVKLYPGKTAFELTQLMSWKLHRQDESKGIPPALMRYAFGECLCHLDHLRFIKKITRSLVDGFYRYE